MEIFCHITPDQNDPSLYSLKLQFGDANPSVAKELANLGPKSKFPFKQEVRTVQEILDLLDAYKTEEIRSELDLPGMLDLGMFLYKCTLGMFNKDIPTEEPIDLRIISECEHIHRLPWNLLALGRVFLQRSGWQISLASKKSHHTVKLLRAPLLLIFSPPEEAVRCNTGRNKHIKELLQEITSEDISYEDNITVVDSRAQLKAALRSHFDIFYYYGHGSGSGTNSYLRLADDERSDNPGTMTLYSLAEILKNAAGGPPELCYINACMSNSGGGMGAGLQLGKICPAVIANRTEAWISVAQRQGASILKDLLLSRSTPHEALHYCVNNGDEDAGDISWATPILTRHYTVWDWPAASISNHPERIARDWDIRLDRTSQSAHIGAHLKQILDGKFDTLCCLWYGNKTSGVDLLHDRVAEYVPLRDVDLIRCFLYWEDEMPKDNQERIFEDIFLKSFTVNQPSLAGPKNIKGIPRYVREVYPYDKKILIHIRIKTVQEGSNWATPENFKTFLNWWVENVMGKLSENNIVSVITMGYEVDDYREFEENFKKYLRDPHNRKLITRLLEPLGKIKKTDLENYMQEYDMIAPHRNDDERLEWIASNFGSNYFATLDHLINLHDLNIPNKKDKMVLKIKKLVQFFKRGITVK